MSYRNTRKPRQTALGKQANQNDYLPSNPSARYGRGYDQSEEEYKENELAKALRESLLALFTRVDSVLSGREIQVATSDSVQAAATDGTNIYFNSMLIDSVFTSIVRDGVTKQSTFSKLIKIRGLNYHELSHVLYTPRKGAKFIKDVLNMGQTHPKIDSQSAFKAFNILEDARIESLFTAKYPASIPYFIHTVTELIAKNTNELDAKFPLLYGRKYYPKSIRNKSEKLFVQNFKVSAKDLKAMKNCIDEYRSVVFPKHQSEALKCVETFALLLLKIFENNLPEHGSGNHHEISSGSTDGIREQQKVQEQRNALEEELDDEDEDEEEDSDSDDGNSKNDRHQDSDESDESDESDDDSEEESEESFDSDEDSNDGAESSGASPSRSLKSEDSDSDSEVEKELNDIQVRNEESLNTAIAKELKQIRQSASEYRFKRFFDNIEEPNFSTTPPQSYRALSNTISTALSKLKADTDNQWDKDTNFGNLNVIKKVQSRGLHTDFFDQWIDEGDERPDAEVVILLDQSSSMYTQQLDWEKYYEWQKALLVDPSIPRPLDLSKGTLISEASCAMWSIKYACQTQDIPCTVIGYADLPSALYTNNSKVLKGLAPIFRAHGSTYPTEALQISEQVFAKSTARYKLLVTITDGDWTDSAGSSKVIQKLNKQGCHTVLIGLASIGRVGNGDMSYTPSFPRALTHPTKESCYDSLTQKNVVVEIPVGYGCKSVLAVSDCREIAKKIGALLVKGVVNSR